jgi:hypothetical protein
MNDLYYPSLDSLEDRLGDALGLALGIIRDPEGKALTNQNMAIIEKAFKEWCDKQIDELANEKNSF